MPVGQDDTRFVVRGGRTRRGDEMNIKNLRWGCSIPLL